MHPSIPTQLPASDPDNPVRVTLRTRHPAVAGGRFREAGPGAPARKTGRRRLGPDAPSGTLRAHRLVKLGVPSPVARAVLPFYNDIARALVPERLSQNASFLTSGGAHGLWFTRHDGRHVEEVVARIPGTVDALTAAGVVDDWAAEGFGGFFLQLASIHAALHDIGNGLDEMSLTARAEHALVAARFVLSPAFDDAAAALWRGPFGRFLRTHRQDFGLSDDPAQQMHVMRALLSGGVLHNYMLAGADALATAEGTQAFMQDVLATPPAVYLARHRLRAHERAHPERRDASLTMYEAKSVGHYDTVADWTARRDALVAALQKAEADAAEGPAEPALSPSTADFAWMTAAPRLWRMFVQSGGYVVAAADALRDQGPELFGSGGMRMGVDARQAGVLRQPYPGRAGLYRDPEIHNLGELLKLRASLDADGGALVLRIHLRGARFGDEAARARALDALVGSIHERAKDTVLRAPGTEGRLALVVPAKAGREFGAALKARLLDRCPSLSIEVLPGDSEPGEANAAQMARREARWVRAGRPLDARLQKRFQKALERQLHRSPEPEVWARFFSGARLVEQTERHWLGHGSEARYAWWPLVSGATATHVNGDRRAVPPYEAVGLLDVLADSADGRTEALSWDNDLGRPRAIAVSAESVRALAPYWVGEFSDFADWVAQKGPR